MLDHDRKVALQQLPRHLRAAFSALWNLDLAFADVVSTSSDPHLGAIRLAWWRERLEEIDQQDQTPAEPRLREAARELPKRGASGEELSKLEDAWSPLLEPFPWGEEQANGLRLRGSVLFGLGARLLGGDPVNAEAAGAFWSLADGAAHCSDPQSRQYLLKEARHALAAIPGRMPRHIRPLTVLIALAAAECIRGSAGWGRLSAALRHRLFGSFPRG